MRPSFKTLGHLLVVKRASRLLEFNLFSLRKRKHFFHSEDRGFKVIQHINPSESKQSNFVRQWTKLFAFVCQELMQQADSEHVEI